MKINQKIDLKDIWKYEIEPYLDEYFFDDENKFKELTWEALTSDPDKLLYDWS